MKAGPGDKVTGGQGDKVPEVMTVKQAGEYIGMSGKFIRQQCQLGVFPHNKIGGRIRICRRHIDEHLDRLAKGRI